MRVFENRALREKTMGGRRKTYNEEFRNLYASLNITRVIKSRRMRRAGHAECMRVTNKDRGWKFFSSPPRLCRLWVPPSLLSDG
jgi:hypothetical protein